MDHSQEFYIGGTWVSPGERAQLDVVNPATEEPIAKIALGTEEDVHSAVTAARSAFSSFSQWSVEARRDLLNAICDGYKKRFPDLVHTLSCEMGAPLTLAQRAQVPAGLGHLKTMARLLSDFPFEESVGSALLVREPIGVCALITPWNWPLNQITAKVAPALAAGCTMVLKPSEVAPLNAILFTEVLHEAGVPPGVFNLVHGLGPEVGAAMSRHPDVDMVSFTGSTRAGVEVAKNAAPTVKRVAQELGGKSANVVLDGDGFEKAVTRGLFAVCNNTGQSCNAPARMLVPHDRMEEAAQIAAGAAKKVMVGDPEDKTTTIGPLVSETQFERVQDFIQIGVSEGARLAAGGAGRPDGFDRGYYVQPTVFSHVTNDMVVAREEIFGPVLVLIGYEDDDDAVRIANDTVYGLAGYVSGDLERARSIARRIRSGQVNLNGVPPDQRLPFGGFKHSGNGREWGSHGLEEFLEVKAILGYGADS